MKNYIQSTYTLALMMVSALILSGCETIETPDGRIPDEYLSVARTLEGTYSGQFEGQSAELTLRLDGNMPVLTYRDARGSDILAPHCGSVIGNLKSFRVRGSDTQSIDNAKFDFNPGNCARTVLGRKIEVSLRQRDERLQLIASILKESYQVWVPGNSHCWVDGSGYPQCTQDPGRYETHYRYLNGKFIR